MDKGFDVERELKGKYKGGTLENWHKQEVANDQAIIWGNVHGDNRFSNGERIHTSLVIAIHEDVNIVETRNTYYTLGEPQEAPKPLTAEEQAEKDKALELLSRAIF